MIIFYHFKKLSTEVQLKMFQFCNLLTSLDTGFKYKNIHVKSDHKFHILLT